MKHILYLLLLTHILIANNQFSNQEKSVFEQPQEQVEQIQNKEIVTFEQEVVQEENNPSFNISTGDDTVESTDNLNEDSTLNQSSPSLKETLPLEQSEQTEITQSEESIESESATVNPSIEVMKNLMQDNTEGALLTNQDTVLDENAQEQNSEEELIEEIPSIDYFTKVEFDNASRAKSLYLSYPFYPKKIYKNQRFEIVLKALVTTDDFYKVETRFIDSKNMTVLNPDNTWILKDNNTFENTYYFKAYDEDFVMPTIQVLLYQDEQIIESQLIQPEEMTFTEIGKDDERFSFVIAKDLTVNAYKTKQYNNNELITILDVKAIESNLEDFKLKYIEEQGFSKIVDNYPEQNMLYYMVLPIHKKKIVFNYYNTKDKKFKKITIPLVLENELISTQTDLNPNNSNMLFYKKVALSILSVVFLALFAWKRKYIYLIALLISMIFLIVYMMPNKQAFVKSNTTIYILPTNNSTIFYKTQKANVVQVAMKKEHFVKIIMNINNKKIIGWIKEEQLVEN